MSHGEHLCQSADLIGRARSAIERDLRLYHLLGALRSVGRPAPIRSPARSVVFARSAREALAAGVAARATPAFGDLPPRGRGAAPRRRRRRRPDGDLPPDPRRRLPARRAPDGRDAGAARRPRAACPEPAARAEAEPRADSSRSTPLLYDEPSSDRVAAPRSRSRRSSPRPSSRSRRTRPGGLGAQLPYLRPAPARARRRDRRVSRRLVGRALRRRGPRRRDR